jgi:hypothetical protein
MEISMLKVKLSPEVQTITDTLNEAASHGLYEKEIDSHRWLRTDSDEGPVWVRTTPNGNSWQKKSLPDTRKN